MQNGEAAKANLPAPSGKSREWKIVLLFCTLAAVRVFIFSAAFPFFNNVDEAIHFDLVLKYSHGDVPRKMETISPDSAGYLALMNSHAYLGIPERFPGGQLPPPPWTLPAEKMKQDLDTRSADWQIQENYEVSQTPLYYSLAGAWWHVGQWLGFHDGRLVYWLRFLNVMMVAALVWISYVAARTLFPDNLFLQTGAPALIAFIPQTEFYSISNDLLPALCFGITFICLLKWLSLEKPTVRLGVMTGLAFAATYLAKETTLPLLAVVGAMVLVQTWQAVREGKFRTALPVFAGFLFCSELPILGWTIWCKVNFGDFTGSIVKTRFLNWTVKPFAEWWQHPIFTPGGFWTFLSGLIGTFWQGEFFWHHQPMALPGTSASYTILSLVLLAAALSAIFSQGILQPQRQALQLSLSFFVAAVGFFALMSIVYDFHDCPYPSRDYPYFTSGRLLLGVLIPFSLLIVCGINQMLKRFKDAAKFSVLTALILIMFALEVATNWPAFSNEYNWFHLP
jgi:branched-subunit amino acid transport protein